MKTNQTGNIKINKKNEQETQEPIKKNKYIGSSFDEFMAEEEANRDEVEEEFYQASRLWNKGFRQ